MCLTYENSIGENRDKSRKKNVQVRIVTYIHGHVYKIMSQMVNILNVSGLSLFFPVLLGLSFATRLFIIQFFLN